MKNLTFRILNPRSDWDVENYFKLVLGLSDFCNNGKIIDQDVVKYARFHMGAIEYVDTDLQGKQLPPLEENAHEFVFVCENNGKFVGYSKICSYHIVDGKCPNDDIGLLHEIFVLDNYRNGKIAYKLLQLSIDKLIEKGKNKAICNVQEYNPNRFLHFAMANNNIIKQEEITRKNGTKTIDYTLLVDLHRLKNMSLIQLAKKAVEIKKATLNKNK